MSDDDEVVTRRRYLEEEARADKAEAERDAALARLDKLKEDTRTHLERWGAEHQKDREAWEKGRKEVDQQVWDTLQERNAALAQVEGLQAVVRPLLISHCSNMHLSALCSLCRQANAALSSTPPDTRDEALRVAKEALESWLSEEGDVADALEKSEAALSAIEEATRV